MHGYVCIQLLVGVWVFHVQVSVLISQIMTIHIIYLNFEYSTEYYTVQSILRDVVVNPDGVSPSVVLHVKLNLKVFLECNNCTGTCIIDLFYDN